MPNCMVHRQEWFRGTHCLHLHSKSEDIYSTFLWNIHTFLPYNKTFWMTAIVIFSHISHGLHSLLHNKWLQINILTNSDGCYLRTSVIPKCSDKWHSLLLLSFTDTVPPVLKRSQATSKHANIWSFDSIVDEVSIILGYAAALERKWLSSDMATYPTGPVYFKKSYFVVHYLTILGTNNSGCMVKGMQLTAQALKSWVQVPLGLCMTTSYCLHCAVKVQILWWAAPLSPIPGVLLNVSQIHIFWS